MLQEVKSSTHKVNGKRESLIKEIEDVKKNQMEILELKDTRTKIRNSVDREDRGKKSVNFLINRNHPTGTIERK